MKDIPSHLEQLKQQGLLRRTKTIEQRDGVYVVIHQKRLLSFCSNDYLGLADHPKITEALIDAAKTYGVGSGSAHLITGHSYAHQALEESLAEFTQRPRALLFSTGYMANLGIINGLTDRHDWIFQDKLNHASLLDGAQLSHAQLKRYPHLDYQRLEKNLTETKDNALVVTDSVFSMDGDIAPLREIANSCNTHQAMMMVDDAHGFGILGKQGRGALNAASLSHEDTPIYMATLGKAIGTFGAFVAGSNDLIELLMQQARSYIYTTATPPALAAATITALSLVKAADHRRDHLNQLIKTFRKEASLLGFQLLDSTTAIQPIIAQSSEQAVNWSQQLYDQGILISAIRPPTVPKKSPRLRITFSANHTFSHLNQLLDSMQQLDQHATT